MREQLDQVADLHAGPVCDGATVDAGCERRRVQPGACAGWTGAEGEEALGDLARLLAQGGDVTLEIAPGKAVKEPFVLQTLRLAIGEGDLHRAFAAVQQRVHLLGSV